MSGGKQSWYLPYIFGSSDLVGKTIIKIIINAITQIRDKTAFFLSIRGFFHEHSRFTGQRENGKANSLTHLYLFHPPSQTLRH